MGWRSSCLRKLSSVTARYRRKSCTLGLRMARRSTSARRQVSGQPRVARSHLSYSCRMPRRTHAAGQRDSPAAGGSAPTHSFGKSDHTSRTAVLWRCGVAAAWASQCAYVTRRTAARIGFSS
eukprot:scaffold11629_cov63-Phaeocystis_antarctica.AAC.10